MKWFRSIEATYDGTHATNTILAYLRQISIEGYLFSLLNAWLGLLRWPIPLPIFKPIVNVSSL